MLFSHQARLLVHANLQCGPTAAVVTANALAASVAQQLDHFVAWQAMQALCRQSLQSLHSCRCALRSMSQQFFCEMVWVSNVFNLLPTTSCLLILYLWLIGHVLMRPFDICQASSTQWCHTQDGPVPSTTTSHSHVGKIDTMWQWHHGWQSIWCV